MRIAIGLVLVLAGCGGGVTDAERLQGSWGLESDSCLLALTFDGSQYEADVICTLTDGSIGLQAEAGTFTASGGTLTTTASHASCPLTASEVSTQLSYSFEGETLRLVTPSGILILARLEPGGGSGAAIFGCYNAGLFTPREVTPVP